MWAWLKFCHMSRDGNVYCYGQIWTSLYTSGGVILQCLSILSKCVVNIFKSGAPQFPFICLFVRNKKQLEVINVYVLIIFQNYSLKVRYCTSDMPVEFIFAVVIASVRYSQFSHMSMYQCLYKSLFLVL